MYQSTWAVITKYRRLVSLNSADISFLIGLEAKSSCSDWQQTLFLRVPLFLVVDGCLLAVASQGVFSEHRENFGVSSSCYKGRPFAQSLQSCLTLCDPMTVARQAPLSLGFSRQGCWSGCHALLQGIFPTQGWNPSLSSPVWAGEFFNTSATCEPLFWRIGASHRWLHLPLITSIKTLSPNIVILGVMGLTFELERGAQFSS